MRISITGTRLELTQAIQTYAEKKSSILNRLVRSFEKSGELLLRIEIARSTRHHKKGDAVYYVEFTLALPKKVIRIEEYDANVRVAIDKAQQRIKSALTDYKNKFTEHKQKGKGSEI